MPRWLAVVLLVAVVLVACSITAWRYVPAVAVKVASSRAHINASVPAYTPAGFSYAGQVHYSPGRVTIIYKEKGNPSQAYAVTQQNSSWDSSSLANNVIGAQKQVQTSDVSGMTVYIYNNSQNAAWVNGGKRYGLENKADLSSDQILHIAQSM